MRTSGWLTLIVFLLAGCGPLTDLAPTVSPTASLPSLPTDTPFLAATLTPTVHATLRPTRAATSTPRPTPTRRPTATPDPSTPPETVGPFLLFSSTGQPAGKVLDLRAAPDGVMWVNTQAGWASLYKNKWTLHAGTQNSVLAGFDELGRVWLVSEKGEAISAWDGARWTKYGPEAVGGTGAGVGVAAGAHAARTSENIKTNNMILRVDIFLSFSSGFLRNGRTWKMLLS